MSAAARTDSAAKTATRCPTPVRHAQKKAPWTVLRMAQTLYANVCPASQVCQHIKHLDSILNLTGHFKTLRH